MTSHRIMASVGAFLILILLLGGCKDSTPFDAGTGLGNVKVTKYVAIGNSITAGYQSGGLFQSGQIYSYPNLISQQLTKAGASIGAFQQPLYSDPGTPDPETGRASRYEIISLVGPVVGPTGAAPGVPINTTLPRPYDNLGIPGAITLDFLDSTAAAVPPRGNGMFSLVLRTPALGKSMMQQAVALHPDLVTFWLGNNDVLGYATSGGVTQLVPGAAFNVIYTQSVTVLRAALPNAKIVLANIPDVRSIPFFTTLGPKIVAGLPAGVFLRYQKHGNNSIAFDSTRFAESTPPLFTLPGVAYANLIGRPSGLWYSLNGITPGPGIDTTKPFGVHPQNPWPDELVLDAVEQANAGAAIASYNQTIATQAQAIGAALVDVNAFFTSLKQSGITVGGIEFTADYISGGLFSLDGVHPSSRGQGLIANLFLKAMNAKFGMDIPLIDVSTLPGIPAPLAKGSALPIVDPNLYRTMQQVFGSAR